MKTNKPTVNFKMPLFSFSIGGFAIILSFLIVFVIYNNSVNKTEQDLYKFYQSKALMLNAIIEEHPYLSDSAILDYTTRLYNSIEKHASDEYICIVDEKSDLILHSLHPNTVGNYAGKNAVFDDRKELCTLSDLVRHGENYLGQYVSSSGENQVAAFEYIPSRKWMIGVHRSQEELRNEIRAQYNWLLIAFAIIVGGFIPFSISALFFAFKKSESQKIAFEKEAQYHLQQKNEEYEAINEELRQANEELIEAKQSVQDSEEKYKALYENAPLSYQSLNEDGSFRDVNPAWLSTLGYERDEVIGKFYKDFLHPDWEAHFEKNFPEFKKRGYVHGVEFKIRHKKGHYIDINFEGCIGYNPDGSFRQTYCVFQDVTDRKKAEIDLKYSEDFLNQTGKLAKIGGWEIDILTMTSALTEETYRIYDLPFNNTLSFEDGIKFYAPEAQPIIAKAVKEAIEKNIPYDLELPFITAKGNHKWVHTKGFTESVNGKVVRLYGTIMDITERVEREKDLKESESLLKTAETISNQGAWRWDIINDKWYFSDNWLQIHGYANSEISREELMKIAFPDDVQIVETAINDALNGKNPYNIEHRIVRQTDGEVRILHSSAECFFDKNGKAERMIGIARDITEKKYAEEKLRESEEIFNRFMEYSPIYVFFKDENMRAIRLSKNYEIMLGKTMDELLGKNTNDLFPSELAKSIVADDQKILEEGKTVTVEEELNGRIYWTIKFPVQIKGKPTYLAGYTMDITERKKAEESLMQTTAFLRKLIDSSALSTWVSDEKGTAVIVNPACLNFFGTTEEEVIGKYNLLKDEVLQSQGFIPEIRKVFEKGEVVEIISDYDFKEVDHVGAESGTHKILKSIFTPVLDTEGKVSNVIVQSIDLTDIKKYEKELIKAKESAEKRSSELIEQQTLFETMFNTIKEGVVITNTNREIVLANNGMLSTFGYNPEEVIGKQTKILYADTDKFTDAGKNIFNKNAVISNKQYLTYYKHKNNTIFPGETFGAKLYNNKGEWIGNIGIIRDVSEREQFIKDIQLAKERAEEGDRLKSAFLANMSHEIRTPMNGIIGFAKMLLKPNLPDEKLRHFSKIIVDSSNQLLSIVNDILDISRIDTGQMEIYKDEVSLNQLLLDTHTFFDLKAKEKKIDFNYTFGLKDKDSLIITDQSKLNQLLNNLISNALKFTEMGSIEFGYNLNKNKQLEFFVKDTGIGIPKKDQKMIFERFIQADNVTHNAIGGTGLGLAICKGYIDAMGGEIWFKSEENSGTEFYFTIPYVSA